MGTSNFNRSNLCKLANDQLDYSYPRTEDDQWRLFSERARNFLFTELKDRNIEQTLEFSNPLWPKQKQPQNTSRFRLRHQNKYSNICSIQDIDHSYLNELFSILDLELDTSNFHLTSSQSFLQNCPVCTSNEYDYDKVIAKLLNANPIFASLHCSQKRLNTALILSDLKYIGLVLEVLGNVYKGYSSRNDFHLLRDFLFQMNFYGIIDLKTGDNHAWQTMFSIVALLLNESPALNKLKDKNVFRDFKKLKQTGMKWFAQVPTEKNWNTLHSSSIGTYISNETSNKVTFWPYYKDGISAW